MLVWRSSTQICVRVCGCVDFCGLVQSLILLLFCPHKSPNCSVFETVLCLGISA